MNHKRYNTKTIQKACRLYKQGMPIRQILRETGISSHSIIYFHCDSKRRATLILKSLAWRKANHKKWRVIANRAARKHYKKHGRNA